MHDDHGSPHTQSPCSEVREAAAVRSPAPQLERSPHSLLPDKAHVQPRRLGVVKKKPEKIKLKSDYFLKHHPLD